MPRRYRIGIFLCAAVMCWLNCISYQHMETVPEMPMTEERREIPAEPAAAGREKRIHKYCLKEKDGLVCVYLENGTTLYETTSIRIHQLPPKLRQEILRGKYLNSEHELYDFLENYSS